MNCAQHPPPAPHRALLCYDVLCTIFEQLAASEELWYDYDVSTGDASSWYERRADCEQRRTLARCARVCRAFFTPAVAVLWRDLDSLAPVARVAAAEASDNDNDDTDTDTTRQRVPGRTDLLDVIAPALSSLHLVLRPAPRRPPPSPAECARFVRELLDGLAARAPRLRYLRISTTAGIREAWLEPVAGFRELDTVDLLERIYQDVSTSPLLRPLAAMPALHHLKIRLPADVPDLAPGAFPALRTLTLDATHAPLRSAASLIAALSSPHMHALALQNCPCTAVGVGAALHAVCTAIRTRVGASLRTLELSLRGAPPVASDARPLLSAIEPLLELRDLADVRITLAPEVVVLPASARDLDRMAEAWPGVRTLHLSYNPGNAPPSLEDVAALAHRCTELQDLVLPGIDASIPVREKKEGEASPHYSAPATMTPTRGLRSLSLADRGCQSRIPDPARLAAFLDGLFPEVEWRCPPLPSQGWRETVQEVVQLRVRRMVGREW
ncbi:hypothetical protein C8Q76DRAFT_833322 [Earliella scabrosa]|nr:hypothetical protein C8Q76DRAFT_833322 [Earliella scabrosa]